MECAGSAAGDGAAHVPAGSHHGRAPGRGSPGRGSGPGRAPVRVRPQQRVRADVLGRGRGVPGASPAVLSPG